MLTSDGGWKWILSRARIVAWDENGIPLRIIGTHLDITERKNLERRLAELATTDELTGLSNRRHFLESGTREVERSRRSGAPLALLMLDLDNFKDVNDRYGHPTGDTVLRLFSETCAKTLRCTDIIGRLGGEEFGILLPDTDAEGAKTLAERVRQDIERTAFPSAGGRFSITVSIGIATMTDPEDSLNDLMHRSDHALYESKRAGRNRATVM
jgi:diguanylate cyclase (GGDEF)-like protein